MCIKQPLYFAFEIPLYYTNDTIPFKFCNSPFSCSHNMKLPENEHRILIQFKDPVYLIKFVSPLHLGHTFNNLMYLWYIISNPNIFPTPSILFFVDYSSNNEFGTFLLHFFKTILKKNNPKISILNREYILKLIRRENIVCFSHAYINQEVHVGGFGGYFIDRKSYQKFKDSIFDFIKYNETINAKLFNQNLIRILIVTRNNRNIMNFNEIAHILKTVIFSMNIKFKIEYNFFTLPDFSNYSPTTQIQTAFNIDIYISPHGTSLFNILWLNNKKCVIELFPSFFIRTDWMYSSYDYDLIYYPVFSHTYYNWDYLSNFHRGNSPSLLQKLKDSYVPNYREDFYISPKQIIQSFFYCFHKLV